VHTIWWTVVEVSRERTKTRKRRCNGASGAKIVSFHKLNDKLERITNKKAQNPANHTAAASTKKLWKCYESAGEVQEQKNNYLVLLSSPEKCYESATPSQQVSVPACK
jgi:hypothetical protein